MIRFDRTRFARLIAGVAASALFGVVLAGGPAYAHWDHPEHNWHGYHHGWSGGYWGAPPVVYGDPYAYGYYPPPGVGINIGGVHIGIR
ncbi:MAG TPA: hypothetical protein VMB84_17960 [Stellaceae bacterium]|nr:hypothetical protein [Stellaceae bacterium]